MNKSLFLKGIILLILICLVSGFFLFDIGQYFSLEYLKANQEKFDNLYSNYRWQTIGLYMLVYILITAASLPGAAIMTLAGGALFGLLAGTIIVSFASTIGATCAFLAARFLFRDSVQKKFGQRLAKINHGVEKEGAFYLFSLRLIPIFPFFVINLLMALTPIKTITFFLVSQVGMLLGTIAYVNAGTQLGQLESLKGILSPQILLSFLFLAIVPFLGKGIVRYYRQRKINQQFPKPKAFDYNLIAIGAGAGGLVTSYIGAAVKAKVALIEKHQMGGDCLNTGCVPSKALIKSATIAHEISKADQYGLKNASAEVNFQAVMARVHQTIKTIEPHDSVERYESLGVNCYIGEAKITSPYTVEVNGKTLTTKNIVIAAGGKPLVPNIPGIENIDYWTSDTIWNITTLPKRLVVLGGGPIGCELAQCFQRLGAQVTQVQHNARLLPKEDTQASQMLYEQFTQEGIDVCLAHQPKQVLEESGEKILVCEHDGQTKKIPFDGLLVAVGRMPNVKSYGLENIGIELNDRGFIQVDEKLRTNFPNIYACGDVIGHYFFTHVAAHQAWFASVNALFSPIKSFNVDYRVIPWCTFTDPEIAHVGLSEASAQENNIPYETTQYDLSDLDRAIADSTAKGFVKVLTVPGKDTILGATIVGHHAGDLLAEIVLAMKYNLGLNKILGTTHAYPTMAEANKFVAGEWKKAHAPEKVLNWLESFHRWRRS